MSYATTLAGLAACFAAAVILLLNDTSSDPTSVGLGAGLTLAAGIIITIPSLTWTLLLSYAQKRADAGATIPLAALSITASTAAAIATVAFIAATLTEATDSADAPRFIAAAGAAAIVLLYARIARASITAPTRRPRIISGIVWHTERQRQRNSQ